MGVGSEQWSSSTDIYPFQMDISLDTSDTSASCGWSGEGAPATPVESTDMQTPLGTALIFELWRAQVCVVTFTTP